MSLVRIYQCLCDPTRLRILNLLSAEPLCVCHLQEILGEPQVKISKHLRYLKQHGMVEARREANWMIYRVPAKPTRELEANLACLQDCMREDPLYRREAEQLRRLRQKFARTSPVCCPPKTAKTTAKSCLC